MGDLEFKTIIWDFDGTIVPFDSEQGLTNFHLATLREQRRLLTYFLKSPLVKLTIFMDRKGLLSNLSKHFYTPSFRGISYQEIETYAEKSAGKIDGASKNIIRLIHEKGFRNIILSCGSTQLIELILTKANLIACFEKIVSNPFVLKRNKILWARLVVGTPQKKIELMKEMNIDPEKTIAVGDGFTDLPLLEEVAFPILLDPNGSKKKYYAGKKWTIIKHLSQLECALGL